MKKIYLLISLLTLVQSAVFAQGNATCAALTPACATEGFSYFNTTNQPFAQSDIDYGCLGSTPNAAWFYLFIDEPGDVAVQISQTSTAGNPLDVDYILWGPFTSNPYQVSLCNPTFLNPENQVSCSYSAAPIENFVIYNNVEAYYILLVTNYSNQAGTIVIEQYGGPGSTNCEVVCETPADSYTQGFEGGETNCIAFEDVNGANGGSGWAINTVFPADSGNRSMVYTYDVDLPGDDWFFTGRIALIAGTNYALQFKYRSGLGPNIVENLEVRYGNTASATGMTTQLLNFEGISTNFGNSFSTATATFTPTISGTYYVGFRCFSEADQGYIQIDNISVNSALAAESFEKSAISFFPNPVKDVLILTNAEKFSSVDVYNLLGQKVLSQNGSTSEINMSGLTSGAYIVKLTDGISVKSIKIIKE